MKVLIRRSIFILTTSIVLSFSLFAQEQKVYFADGYHGGVYGHYPDWVTAFILSELDNHNYWCVNLEIEPETYDSLKVNNPDAYAAFTTRFANLQESGRIEFVNPAYAQPYAYNISGESLIRQFQYGMKKLWDHFPDARFTSYSVEEPCFTSSMPQILQSLGFKYAVLKNPNTCWGGYTRAFGGDLVEWIGPDGTSIPTVPRYACEMLEENSTWQTTAWTISNKYIDTCLASGIEHPVGMCFQDAGWNNGPWIGKGNRSDYNASYISWTNYFEKVANLNKAQPWHFSQEDIQVSLVWGSQVLQKIAREVRNAENEIVMAEKLASLGSIYGNYQWPEEQFDEAWRTLMLAQHHDCWIVPYNGRPGNTWSDKVTRWTNTTCATAEDVIISSAKEMQPGKQSAGKHIVRVYNTVIAPRKEVVELPIPWTTSTLCVKDFEGNTLPSFVKKSDDAESKILVFQADVPSMGYADFQVEESEPESAIGAIARVLEDGTFILENELYKITLDPEKGGRIRSLISKKLDNREIIDPESSFSFNELRGYFYDLNEYVSSTDMPVQISILEEGPFRAKVKISGKIGIHPFHQVLTLEKGSEIVDIDLQIEWLKNPSIGAYSERRTYDNKNLQKAFYIDSAKLLVHFPLQQEKQLIYKNAPFDVCESRMENTFFSSWDSIKHNIILNWIDIMDAEENFGVSILTDHTTAYTFGNDLPPGMVVQYSGRGLWGRNYRIHSDTKIHYALRVHPGRWDEAECWSSSVNWNEELIPVYFETGKGYHPERRAFLETSIDGLEVTSMLREGNDMLIRLFNAEASEEEFTLSIDCHFEEAEFIELDNRIISKAHISKNNGGGKDIRMAIPRFGFSTIRLINIEL